MIGCAGDTLLEWAKKAEVNSGKPTGIRPRWLPPARAYACADLQ
jgi:hypothetical protein